MDVVERLIASTISRQVIIRTGPLQPQIRMDSPSLPASPSPEPMTAKGCSKLTAGDRIQGYWINGGKDQQQPARSRAHKLSLYISIRMLSSCIIR